ncbi:MAG: SPFH domain-containing protein [Clostridia bacterium]|nr:SPFH domain-containing protein [Clostridia bacterium]
MKAYDVIKYEGDNSTFVWKHPCEDFNTGTQLIVHESQEALFFMNGQALDLFGAGRHTLETENLPLLTRLFDKLTGKEKAFHCEVYFVNKTVQMALKWGTDSKIRFLEPTYGIPVEIGASGEMNLAVSDARKLLVKLVGTMNGIAWGDEGAGFTKSIASSFRPMISTAVKSTLPSCIKSAGVDIVEIDEHLDDLSKSLRDKISAQFEDYGLTVPELYITNVLLPEDDPNFRRLKELHTIAIQTRMSQADAIVKSARADADAEIAAAQRKAELERQTTETEIARRQAERDLIKAQAEAQAAKMAGFAEAEVMAAKGYTQKDVLTADVQKAYAEGIGNMNITGGGSVASDMIGLGLGVAAAGAVAPGIGEMFKGISGASAPAAPTPAPTSAPAEEKCAKCGATLPEGAKFCLECGERVAPKVSAETVVCPGCGSTVPKGKFCPECGHKFVTACPKCGSAVTPGAKFCLECGERL